MRRRSSLLAALVACVLVAACKKSPIGVDEVRADVAYREVNAHALNAGQLSAVTREALHLLDLQAAYDEAPLEAIASMHQAVIELGSREALFSLAETSYHYAAKKRDRDAYLAAAVYAYLYLLGDEGQQPPNPYDRRFRVACDLYNRGLEEAFGSSEEVGFVPRDGMRTLPVGQLDVRVDWSHIPWDRERFTSFLPADGFRVRGLKIRRRSSGLGVPLIAVHAPVEDVDFVGQDYLPSRINLPVSAFLRLDGGLATLADGTVSATLEMYSADDTGEVAVGEHAVPLEADPTTALAYSLNESRLWDFSIKRFFGGEAAADENQLVMTRPYRPGRIPVVFVHGTASNPAWWAEMSNTLQIDPEIRERYQMWFFLYSTGNPIAYSAASLRDFLRQVVADVDPDGTDLALQQMVVVGHSQGGLLTKMTVVEGSETWWEQVMGSPIDEFDLTPEQRQVVDELFVFDPLPSVKRVIFISTPHRGSFLAERWYSRMFSRMISVPSKLRDTAGDFFTSQADKLPADFDRSIPTSVKNMDSKSPFLRVLADSPIAEGVKSHSIIPVDGDDIENGNDGVVEYKSAHIEGVDSELVLRATHSCQDHPKAILEVRRILLEHLAESSITAEE